MIINIQKRFRGCMLRKKRLPTVMYAIQKYLKTKAIRFSNQNEDGRINSCFDESLVIQLLIEEFGPARIKPQEKRLWSDVLVYDYMYGWIPINIKSTTTKTSDNAGNLAMCVYAYTDEHLVLDKRYANGELSKILTHKLKNKKYNTENKKDYYFLVLNKTNASDIIVNSIKGLTEITKNINNLPFQINWDKNRVFKYEKIKKVLQRYKEIHPSEGSTPSWKETHMSGMTTWEL